MLAYNQTTDEVISTAVKNRFRAWCGTRDETAETRLSSKDFFRIGHTPKFKLDPKQPIFTMGSCFAREVESALIKVGVPLALDGYGVEADQFASWDADTRWGGGVPIGTLSRGALNKYSVNSMTAEIFRVISDIKYPDDGLFEIRDGLWFDPHSSGLKLTDYNSAKANRRRIHDAMSRIKTAATVILTLGLTETWIDVSTGIVMNNPLSGADLRRHKDRFRFKNFGYSDILQELRTLIAEVTEKCNSDMRFIVTVSPVPLGVTFSSLDVVAANSYSKATLRAVAAAISDENDNVDYFPSYEYVTSSPRSLTWKEDQLHVRPEMVEHIMTNFVASYLN